MLSELGVFYLLQGFSGSGHRLQPGRGCHLRQHKGVYPIAWVSALLQPSGRSLGKQMT